MHIYTIVQSLNLANSDHREPHKYNQTAPNEPISALSVMPPPDEEKNPNCCMLTTAHLPYRTDRVKNKERKRLK